MAKYLIIHYNCDCESGRMARPKAARDRWLYGPRAPCGHIMGCMQWSVLGEVSASGEYDALKKYREQNMAKAKHAHDVHDAKVAIANIFGDTGLPPAEAIELLEDIQCVIEDYIAELKRKQRGE